MIEVITIETITTLFIVIDTNIKHTHQPHRPQNKEKGKENEQPKKKRKRAQNGLT